MTNTTKAQSDAILSAERLTRLEDLEAIRALSARYSLAIDTRDYPALRELLTDDATFGGTSDGASSVKGADEIVKSVRARLEAGGPTFHSIYSVVIEMNPGERDVATGVASCRAETRSGSDKMVNVVRYQDCYRRTTSGWRIETRMLSFPMR